MSNAPHNMTPNAEILQQMEGHWQLMATMILWKLNGEKKLTITSEEMKQFREQFEKRGGAVMFAHGHKESIDFQVIDSEAATKIQEYSQEMEAAGRKHSH